MEWLTIGDRHLLASAPLDLQLLLGVQPVDPLGLTISPAWRSFK
jgi:hypothetical protein